MTKENVKPIQSEVNVETWKKLKMLAIQKDLSLSNTVREILERSMNSKKFEVQGE